MPLTQQYSVALLFYVTFTAFALIGLPVTLRLFESKLASYGTAKLFGLATFGLFIWLLSSAKILDYQNTAALYILLGAVILVAIFFIAKHRPAEQQQAVTWKATLKSILWFEAASVALYFAYLYLRSLNPAAYGTERFMDMMLLTSSSKAHYFPFTDSWYAGHAINYYYYGQYLLGLIARLTHTSYSLAYNLCIGVLYSTATVLAGLFVYTFTKSKWAAVLGGFLVTTAGNMFYAGCAVKTFLAGTAICSYASSTRLYTPSYIINEIPSYSFTVGDLHAHFIALPFFILALFFICRAYALQKPTWLLFIATAVTFTTSSLVNPSDVVSLGVLLGMVILYKLSVHRTSPMKKVWAAEKNWVYFGIGVVVATGVATLPFTSNFVSPVSGIGFSPAFAAAHQFWGTQYQYPTPLLAQLGMWGAYVAALVWFAVATYRTRKSERPEGSTFWLLCAATSLMLLVGVELFFVKDIYHIANPPYFRANTTFKFGYHVWTLLSLSFAACSYAILTTAKKPYKILYGALLAVFIFFSLFYPYQAIQQFYLASGPGTTSGTGQPTLDGIQFMQRENPDDYAAVQYLNSLPSTENRPVVIEAAGDSYSYFARIASFTGSIAPIGWETHEWTWRFQSTVPSTDYGYTPIASIAQDVKTIYESTDVAQTAALLKQYSATYVYIGNEERSTYINLDEAKFYQLGKLVFSKDGAEVFKVN